MGTAIRPLFVLETSWWAVRLLVVAGQRAGSSCGLAASWAGHGVWSRIGVCVGLGEKKIILLKTFLNM